MSWALVKVFFFSIERLIAFPTCLVRETVEENAQASSSEPASPNMETLTRAPLAVPEDLPGRLRKISPALGESASLAGTPEVHRRARKAFLVDEKVRKRSAASLERRRSSEAPPVTNTGQRTSMTSDDSEGSRKSSMSSGRKRSLFHSSGSSGGSRDSKQFAVTFFVNENDKTRLVDMLHRAKNVISKKVERVMGKKTAPSTPSAPPSPKVQPVSNTDALTSILESWVSTEEAEDRREQRELNQLIAEQEEQVQELKKSGLEPPVAFSPVVHTIVSPVPEEDEADLEEEENDLAVQEVVEGQDTLLKPPSATRFQLPRSQSPEPPAPPRPLTPVNNVPRHFSHISESELYPPMLRRPSSHYDESAQAAASRPVSPRPSVDSSNENNQAKEEELPPSVVVQPSFPLDLGQIQRPESMTVPVGGVWRPDDSDAEVSLFGEDDNDKEREKDVADGPASKTLPPSPWPVCVRHLSAAES